MKRILTTTAMVAMTAGSAFAFDSTATGTALDAEVTTANNAIDAVDVTVTFERYDGTTDTFTPAVSWCKLQQYLTQSLIPLYYSMFSIK